MRYRFPIGHKQFSHPQKGKKLAKTLLKEERRARFDEEISKIWIATIKKLKAEYVADQFMGKAPDKVEVSSKSGVVILPSLKKNEG